jgi:hypothetical protein
MEVSGPPAGSTLPEKLCPSARPITAPPAMVPDTESEESRGFAFVGLTDSPDDPNIAKIPSEFTEMFRMIAFFVPVR